MVTQENIVNKVREIMNEAAKDNLPEEGFLEEDTLSLETYIISCIPDALSLIINSSHKCVNPKNGTSLAPTPNSDGTGYVILPDDFVSLVTFKMQGWKRIVSQAYTTDSEIYKAQCNENTRAGVCKPVCILSVNPEGKRILEYYSVKGSPVIELFVYEAGYNPEEGLNISESDSLFQALCYMVASLVYSIFENQATAKEMQTISINLLNDKENVAAN